MSVVAVSAALAVVVACAIGWLVKRRAYTKIYDAVPGLPPNPILGSILQMGDGTSPEIFAYYRLCIEKFKRVYRNWIGPLPLVVAIHPEPLKTMFTETYTKAWNYRLFETFLGKYNMFVRSCDYSRRLRKIHAVMFHFTMLKSYIKDFIPATETLAEKWARVSGQSIDLPTQLGPLSLDIILRSAFGHVSGCQEKDVPYLRHVKALTEIIMQRSYNPLLWSDMVFNLTPMGKRNREHSAAATEFCMQLIEKRRNLIDAARADGSLTAENEINHPLTTDFVGQFIVHNDGNGYLSNDEILSAVQGVVFAAHDTTACALTFILHTLARFPQYQDRVREELLQVCGEDTPTLDSLNELVYMQMFIQESMRMYPPVPLLGRTSEKEMNLDGYVLPANSWLEINVWSAHHNPDVWEEPEKFDPERFAAGAEQRHAYAWIPFAAGTRNCLGQKYAMMEMKIVLAMVLRKFYILPDPESPAPTVINHAVLSSTTPMRVIVESREEGCMRQTASKRIQ